jgi:hypothetical protein
MEQPRSPRRYEKAKADVDAEFVAARTRHDLEPAEIQNSGFPVEHHERATVAAALRPVPDLGAPLSRSPIRPTSG